MKKSLRKFFDDHVEAVLEELPRAIHILLETVPIHVEDRPSRETRRQMELHANEDLYGLYTGVPLTERHVDGSHLPDVVTIYRESLMEDAMDEDGMLDEDELREQIRITILHELAHHHGFSEEELEELGY